MMWRASDGIISRGTRPPFVVRPGLIDGMMALYDGFRRHLRTIDEFERVMVGALAPGAEMDRGAARLLAQTHYLTAVFRAYDESVVASGAIDEHRLRDQLLSGTRAAALRHLVLATADQAAEPDGLWPADFDLLTRLDGLER